MAWLDREVKFWWKSWGGMRVLYIFYEMPRQCIVTWELIPHRSGLERRVLYIGGNERDRPTHEMG